MCAYVSLHCSTNQARFTQYSDSRHCGRHDIGNPLNFLVELFKFGVVIFLIRVFTLICSSKFCFVIKLVTVCCVFNVPRTSYASSAKSAYLR